MDYFGCYAHTGVHLEMLRDSVRTCTYRDAINATVRDKVVLDVGCGTGILSIFAAKAGAAHVYAVEASAIADMAEKIFQDNGMSDRVTLLRGKVEDVELPQKVDIIVSEWMGYCCLYESMLSSVVVARNRWLKPEGLMIPSRIEMYVAPFFDDDLWSDQIMFWKDVHGVDMSAMIPQAVKDEFEAPQVSCLPPQNQLATPSMLGEIDCTTVNVEGTKRFVGRFDTSSMLCADLQGFALWFAAVLVELPDGLIGFNTGPCDPDTHWRQTLLHVQNPVSMVQDQQISGTVVLEVVGESRDIEISVDVSIAPAQPNEAVVAVQRKWIMNANAGS